jgi:riboflavin kinase/FMN adenylyltransferase
MQIICGLSNLPSTLNGCVATIGNFDGVHLGHQQLLSETLALAQDLKLPSIVIIFEPQPAEFFKQKQAPARLTRLREKILAIAEYAAIDYLLCLPFNTKLANLTPEEFIHTILVNKLSVKWLITGDDFRFGYKRQGDIALLQALGEKKGFKVQQNSALTVNNQRISSTQIRHYLAQGELKTAQAMLGRHFSLSGQVVRGDQRGRQLGFPTANIFLKRKVSPLAGVYAVNILGIGNKPLSGVANIGTRPTVDGTRSLLEVYLFDFNQDIYGKHLKVEFLTKLRDEQKFSSLDALIQQISQDVELAKQVCRQFDSLS